jgi:imidazolonepropionase-like amidohydrolase
LAGRQATREGLDKVRAYLRDKRAYALAKARGEEVEEPDRAFIKGKLAVFERLLTGQATAIASASNRRTLIDIANLTQTYGIDVVITGSVEAWSVASELGRAGVSVVVVPRSRRRADPRLERESGWSIENAATLHDHGVPVTIMSRSNGIGTWGLAGSDLFTLPLEAAFAVRGGLSEQAALEAITLAPARLLGVDDQVGSLEVGKDCDLLLVDGDLLHYETLVQVAVVNGRVAYDKSQEALLRAIRPRAEPDEETAIPQLWPRPLGMPEPPMPERER